MDKVPPGWNDPPALSPATPAQGSKPKTRLLNKRIPFDLSSTNTSTETNRLIELPQMSQCENISSSTDVDQCQETIEVSKVIEKLQKLTENLQDTNKKLDIFKRLNIIKAMWEANELNTQVQLQISTFADSLESNNLKEANDIYSTLTLNSASICSSWIIAFKYILHQFKQ